MPFEGRWSLSNSTEWSPWQPPLSCIDATSSSNILPATSPGCMSPGFPWLLCAAGCPVGLWHQCCLDRRRLQASCQGGRRALQIEAVGTAGSIMTAPWNPALGSTPHLHVQASRQGLRPRQPCRSTFRRQHKRVKLPACIAAHDQLLMPGHRSALAQGCP